MTEQNESLVNILMGSKSDWSTMQHARDMLDQFGIGNECRVLSAHRTPEETSEYVGGAEDRGVEVIIAAAGGAAHLAGVCAAHTVLPVLGVPMTGWATDGLDALLATVQMPRGIPVATVAVDGAVNAALLAVQMLSVTDPALAEAMATYREEMASR